MGVNDKPDDPFANVSKAIAAGDDLPAGNVPETKRKAAPKPKGEWVCPVPADAPDARASHNSHGKPSASWAYRDAAGRLIHWVCRFDKPDGAKEILPQTLWREGGRLGSFKVNVSTGRWADFATGDGGGDLVSLAAFVSGLPQREAAIRLAESMGVSPWA